MNTFKLLCAEIGYRKLNFVFSLVAVVITVTLMVAGPMLVEAYSRATESEIEGLQNRVTESVARLDGAEAEVAAALVELEDQTRRVMVGMGFNLTILHRDTDPNSFLNTGLPSADMPQEFVDRLAGDARLTMVTHLVATLTEEIDFGDDKVRLVGYLPETPQSQQQPQPAEPSNPFARQMQEFSGAEDGHPEKPHPEKPHLDKSLTKFAQKVQKKKKPMGYDIAPGTVQLGHLLGQGRKVDQTMEVLGREFRIATILPEKGSREDVTVAMHLSDAQQLLDKPRAINEIKALECRCAEAALLAIRQQISEILPEVQVFRDTSKADARTRQRAMVKQQHEKVIASHKEALAERTRTLEDTKKRRTKIESLMVTLSRVVTPLVALACAVWVGLLALANVRERRTEIGILRALGKGSAMIAALFLGKAVLLGLLGAAIGCLSGAWLGHWLGVGVMAVPVGSMGTFVGDHRGVLLLALLGAPLISAAASYLPTLSALTQDPAIVLRDQ